MDIKPDKTFDILLDNKFESFEELAHLVSHWDTDFRQLNSEQFKSTIFQAQTGSILIAKAHFGCHVEQHGTTPPGMRTFALFDIDCPELYWFGHLVNRDDLLIFPTHGEVDCFSRSGFSVTTISIPEVLLAEFFECNGVDNLNKTIAPIELVKKTSRAKLNELQQITSQISQNNMSNNFSKPHESINEAFFSDTLQNQILLCIFNIMTDDYFENKNHSYTLSKKNSPQKLNLLIEYIKANNSDSLQVKDLCHMAQISERTLQYLFKKWLGMTPKAYIKGQKLYNIHKVLWQSKSSEIGITTIANNFGFWHMGQFASDYKNLFGELPSKTLKHSTLHRFHSLHS